MHVHTCAHTHRVLAPSGCDYNFLPQIFCSGKVQVAGQVVGMILAGRLTWTNTGSIEGEV